MKALVSIALFSFAVSSFAIEYKIVGGKPGSISTRPWMVALVYSKNPDAHDGQFCGGTLIGSEWVLTAAHCTFGKEGKLKPSNIDIVLGRTKLSSKGGERIRVSEIITHEKYDNDTTQNDIALMRLSRPTTKYAPINVVGKDDERLIKPNTMALALGWGDLGEDAKNFPDQIYTVKFPIVPLKKCEEVYFGKIEKNQICAGFEAGGKDTCQGDSGGPLIVRDEKGENLIAGVVSFGNGCARPGQYGVYSKVPSFIDWIELNARIKLR